VIAGSLHAAPDRVLFDFESGTYAGWTVEGTGFGAKPFDAAAAVPGWRADRRFAGWEGRFMVIVGDTRHELGPPCRLVSRPFTLDRPYLNFGFGAELRPQVRVELWVGGEVVRRAHGNNSYDLSPRGWDVRPWAGREAQLVIVKDTAEAALLRLDHFVLSDTAAPPLDAPRPGNPQEATLARPGEFRLLVPAPVGQIVGHSSLVKGHDGRWHLFGALQEGRYVTGSAMLHAVADALTGPYAVVAEQAFVADKKFNETKVREPFVLFHDGTYYLFYVGNGKDWTGWDPFYRWKEGYYGNSTQGPWGIYLATSRDAVIWERHAGNPLFTDTPFAFTPFVARIGDRWVMYYGGTEPADITKGVHGIITRTSTDLKTWSNRAVAYLRADPIPWPEHSFVHSPHVFRRGDDWFLFAGPMGNRNQSRYHYRQFLCSRDPLRWETTPQEEAPLRGLFVDGGARIFEADGQWWITHSGVYAGGVWLAPLTWRDGPATRAP
jgi:beta-fructofuranosidase